jgi:hypothetical protein
MKKKIEFYDTNKPNIWCGNSDNIPDGYDKVGTRHECFKKGIGVGKPKDEKDNRITRVRILNNVELIKMTNRLRIPIKLNNGNIKNRKRLIKDITTRLGKMRDNIK